MIYELSRAKRKSSLLLIGGGLTLFLGCQKSHRPSELALALSANASFDVSRQEHVVTLSWTNLSSGTSYDLDHWLDGGVASLLSTVPSSQTSFIHRFSSPSGGHNYRVTAKGTGTQSAPTAVARVNVSEPRTQALLNIPPTIQQTSEWCWAACGEMVLRYYRFPAINPNYQCGLVAAWFGVQSACWLNCRLCPYPIENYVRYLQFLTGYGAFVRGQGSQSPDLYVTYLPRPLLMSEIVQEVEGGRPIIAGISPGRGFAIPGTSAHVCAIVGYDMQRNTVVVNDPFPFAFPPYSAYPNPYMFAGGAELQTGQYVIPLGGFVQTLAWAESFAGLRTQR